MMLRFYMTCHGCGVEGEGEEVKRNWLQPIHVLEKDEDDGEIVWMQTQLCPKCARWKPLYWIKVRWKLRIGAIGKWFAPGYGSCGRCKTPWLFVEGHATDYDKGSGCFPLCEQCWSELTPQQRLPYYRELYDSWPRSSVPWPVIERAVLNEKSKGASA